MGLVIDFDVWILAGRSDRQLHLARWSGYGGACMSAITASELLVYPKHVSTAERKARRGVFIESLLSIISALEFSTPIARTFARLIAALPKNVIAGAHDASIAASASHRGYAVLTRNVADFKIFAGLKVGAFNL